MVTIFPAVLPKQKKPAGAKYVSAAACLAGCLVSRGTTAGKGDTGCGQAGDLLDLLLTCFDLLGEPALILHDFRGQVTPSLLPAVLPGLAYGIQVSWAAADRLHRELALAALRKVLAMRRVAPGLIHHAHRGSQGCSTDTRPNSGSTAS